MNGFPSRKISTVLVCIIGLSIYATNHWDFSEKKSTHANIVSDLSRLDNLKELTQNHIDFLTHIGLGERAKNIAVAKFQYEENNIGFVDLSPFNIHMPIPVEVLDFDAQIKNTLITTDPSATINKLEDIEKILDVRLYPVLKNLILDYGIEIFTGTKLEMESYYSNQGVEIQYEFSIPSSATYFFAKSANGNGRVIMAGLVSRDNITAQLITLKLAGIGVSNIQIIGDASHFSDLVHQDINNLTQKIPELQHGDNVLIVAGCGFETTVSNIIKDQLQKNLHDVQTYKGDIISLVYISLKNTVNGVTGIISLNLNYGEITEEIARNFLEKYHCRYVFTGGAGGYIPNSIDKMKPKIGERVTITRSMNEKREVVEINPNDSISPKDQLNSRMHLQISSIFLETYAWLSTAQLCGSSIDVETFYFVKAMQEYNMNNPHNIVKADCGYFVSDYVGEQPLREYSNVYKNYKTVLKTFLEVVFNKSKKEEPPVYTYVQDQEGNFYGNFK